MSQNQNSSISFNIKSEQFVANSILSLKKIFVPTGKKDTWGENKSVVMALLVDFETFGYTFSHNLAFSLSHMEKNILTSWGSTLLSNLKNVVGVRKFEPMYPNFPEQVLNTSEEERFLNAFMQGVGLWVGMRILPKYQEFFREESDFLDKNPPKVLDVATVEDYERWILRMLQANVSYSQSQKDAISCFVDFIRSVGGDVAFFTSLNSVDIGNKENLSYWAKYVLVNTDVETFSLLMSNKFKVITDVLRLVVAIGGGDTSLAGKLTVPKLSRAYRKLILSLVEKVVVSSSDRNQVLENMVNYRSIWIRVAYACHVGEYKNSYPSAFAVFQEIREIKNFVGYNGKIEKFYNDKDLSSLLESLCARPGVFARNLSRLLATEHSSYEKTDDRVARKKKHIQILQKRVAHANALNSRLKSAWERKLKKTVEDYEDEDSNESRFTYVDSYTQSNNQIADHLKRLGFASKQILENDAKALIKQNPLKQRGKTAEVLREILLKNGIDLPEPNYVKVLTVPKLEDLLGAVIPYEHFLLNAEQRNKVLVNFDFIANKVSTPVLLQVHSFFKNIEKHMLSEERYIMPKGGLSKVFIQRGKHSKFDLEDAAHVVKSIEKVLEYRFSTLPGLGNVYISPELQEQNIPFAQRSASKSLRTVARGSKLPVKLTSRTLRVFLWWMDENNNENKLGYDGTDIDLSVTLLDKNYKFITECSFRTLTDNGLTHSGDIRSAPEGACEFIDINLDLIDKNVAYIVPSVHSYSGNAYCDLPECFAGWMSIEGNPQHGEIFDARAVKDKVDLSSKTGDIIPMFFDVKAQKMVWVDSAFGENTIATSSLSQRGIISDIVKMWNEINKPSLYDLFMIHAKARGTLVENVDDADSIFSLYEGLTPFDFEIISSEYMSDVK